MNEGSDASLGERDAAPASDRPALLIVDDEPDLLIVLSVMAEREGYRPLVAASGAEALETLEQGERPAAMVLDLMMPGMSGFQLCRLVKATPEFEAIPILVLTALNQPVDRFRAEDSGADAFLTKPFEIDDILEVLRGFQENRRPNPPARLQGQALP